MCTIQWFCFSNRQPAFACGCNQNVVLFICFSGSRTNPFHPHLEDHFFRVWCPDLQPTIEPSARARVPPGTEAESSGDGQSDSHTLQSEKANRRREAGVTDRCQWLQRPSWVEKTHVYFRRGLLFTHTRSHSRVCVARIVATSPTVAPALTFHSWVLGSQANQGSRPTQPWTTSGSPQSAEKGALQSPRLSFRWSREKDGREVLETPIEVCETT